MICNSTGDYWLGLSSKSRSRRVMTFVECMLLPPECDYCTVLSASLSGLVGRRLSQAGWLAVARVVSSFYCALRRYTVQQRPVFDHLHPRFQCVHDSLPAWDLDFSVKPRRQSPGARAISLPA